MSLWAFRFLLWYLCIMIVQPQHRFEFLYPYRIANLSMLLATGLHAFSAMTEGRPLIRFGPATRLAFLLLIFGLLSQFTGVFQSDRSWNSYIDMLVKNAYALILVEAMAFTVERVWAVHTTLAIASLWWIKGGLRLSAAGATWGMGDRIMGPAAGLVLDPNFFAYMMGVFAPLYLYYSRSADRAWIRRLGLALAVAAVFILLRTGSRGGLIQLSVVGLGLAPLYLRKQKTAVLVATLAIFLLIPLSGRQNIERFKSVPRTIVAYFKGEAEIEKTPDTYSAMERRTKNRDTWALIKRYPLFGVGMNPDDRFFKEEFWGATGQVHCEILMAGRQMGLIGMAMHLGFLLIPFMTGLAIQRRMAGVWPALSDLGYTTKIQALSFAVGGLFLPLPWHPILLTLAGCGSALWLNLRAGEAPWAAWAPERSGPQTAESG